MRILFIHNEDRFFGGAETLLSYFLSEIDEHWKREIEPTFAGVLGCRLDTRLPKEVRRVGISSGRAASWKKLTAQARELWRAHREVPFDLVHVWSARGWELGALVGFLARVPVVGTLHDHPRSSYISKARQRLMRWTARGSLRRVVCVSGALKDACLDADYPAQKVTVIRNGLPDQCLPRSPREGRRARFGFFGKWSYGKGIDGLLEILRHLAGRQDHVEWECWIAGGTGSEENGRWLETVCERYRHYSWWPRLRWLGWVESPMAVLRELDLLIMPSREFDSFPNVLLEAGLAGVGSLATRVGGAGEIVDDGRTGWLVEPEHWQDAAGILAGLLVDPTRMDRVGGTARDHVREQFNVEKMVAKYLELYTTVANHE